MGVIVFLINYDGQGTALGASTAAGKQAAYTFFLGGLFMKQCENLAVRIKPYRTALALAVIVPSLVTLLLTFSLHSLKGTPKPLQSTIPTLMIIPATIVWAYRKRKLSLKTRTYKN